MMNYKILFTFLLLAFMPGIVFSEEPTPASDPVRISLLTCSPGKEIYSLFGHTAIRYEDPSKGVDVVFNYGIFSFNTPNFTWRFVKGETDYQLGVNDYASFEALYRHENRHIWQQELNLTTVEKQKLFAALSENYRPENRVYRYNFFYDNCATRPRDKIEESLSGQIIYAEVNYRQSFRDIVHECSKAHLWERFGMDFCLGVKADAPISYREEMFAPYYLMYAFGKAKIVTETGESKPLVSDTKLILDSIEKLPEAPSYFYPVRTSFWLFILIAGITFYGVRKRKSYWGIDLVLFAAAGLAGCVITFLTLFSEHPAVSHNYLIIAFHPLHLLLLPRILKKEIKGEKCWYHLGNCIILTLFMLLWTVIPQHFNPAVLPLALCLLIRSAGNLILTHKRKK